MSRYELIRWSGLAGLVSGVLIIAGAVAGTLVEPVVSETLTVTGHILLFFLLTGVYATHYAHTGLIGLLGYVLTTIGNVLFVSIQTVASFVLSRIDVTEGMFPAPIPTTGILFGVGLLFLAIANTRVRALPSWPGWLMFTGIALNLVFPRLLGEVPDFVFAIPQALLGVGVAGSGWTLRRN